MLLSELLFINTANIISLLPTLFLIFPSLYSLRLIKYIAANTPIIANKNSKSGIGVGVGVGLGEGV